MLCTLYDGMMWVWRSTWQFTEVVLNMDCTAPGSMGGLVYMGVYVVYYAVQVKMIEKQYCK